MTLSPQSLSRLKSLLTEALTLLGSTQAVPAPQPSPPAPAPAPVAELVATTPALAWGKEVKRIHGAENGQIFMDRVFWVAWKLSQEQGALFDANWLMGVMAFESGRSFSASKKNPVSTATGLIQFMAFTAKEMGTTTTKLAAMTAWDQLNYVYRYFSQKIKERGPIRSIEDAYMAVLWPAGMGKPMDHPIFIKGNSTYSANAGLDKNRDSRVTKAEAAGKVMEQLVIGMQEKNFG